MQSRSISAHVASRTPVDRGWPPQPPASTSATASAQVERPSARPWRDGGGPDALLRGTEFELALDGDKVMVSVGWAGAGASGGQGDIQAFRGAATLFRYDARYAGDVSTGDVGVDARLTERWPAGVAVSRSAGRGYWQVGESHELLKTEAAGAAPLRASGRTAPRRCGRRPAAVWGDGEAENVRNATGLLGTSGLGLRLGAVGTRVAGRRGVSRPLRLRALALRPFGEAHLWRDAGVGQNG